MTRPIPKRVEIPPWASPSGAKQHHLPVRTLGTGLACLGVLFALPFLVGHRPAAGPDRPQGLAINQVAATACPVGASRDPEPGGGRTVPAMQARQADNPHGETRGGETPLGETWSARLTLCPDDGADTDDSGRIP
jgi:hypothetical protein